MKLLPRYDQEMFDFHHKIEALEEQWGREKQELAKVELLIPFEIETKGQTFWKSRQNQVEARLAIIGGERDLIVREQASNKQKNKQTQKN